MCCSFSPPYSLRCSLWQLNLSFSKFSNSWFRVENTRALHITTVSCKHKLILNNIVKFNRMLFDFKQAACIPLRLYGITLCVDHLCLVASFSAQCSARMSDDALARYSENWMANNYGCLWWVSRGSINNEGTANRLKISTKVMFWKLRFCVSNYQQCLEYHYLNCGLLYRRILTFFLFGKEPWPWLWSFLLDNCMR